MLSKYVSMLSKQVCVLAEATMSVISGTIIYFK